MMEEIQKREIPCTINKLTSLRVGDPSTEFNSGCSIVDVNFPTNRGVDVGTIKFKNSYVATVTIRVKFKDPENSTIDHWKTALKDYKLMPNPHCETGSQDFFVINTRTQFTKDVPGSVTGMRFILRQPSPHWVNFSLEQLRFYLSQSTTNKDKPKLNTEKSQEQDTQSPQNNTGDYARQLVQRGIVLDSLTSKLNSMVSMASTIRSEGESKNTSSRAFGVDGSYDVNLLSYT